MVRFVNLLEIVFEFMFDSKVHEHKREPIQVQTHQGWSSDILTILTIQTLLYLSSPWSFYLEAMEFQMIFFLKAKIRVLQHIYNLACIY